MSALVENPLMETLRKEFQDEDYRYAYDEEFANSRMATQIKVIREQQGLKQVELAGLAEMKQSRISALEDVNYNSWSVSTLRRLARALGVRFAFGFESWGELLPEVDSFGRKALQRPKFEDDPAFKEETERGQTTTGGKLLDATHLFPDLPTGTAAQVQFLPGMLPAGVAMINEKQATASTEISAGEPVTAEHRTTKHMVAMAGGRNGR